IPNELREIPHWVVWQYRKTSDDKATKVPLNADRRSEASSTDPSTWTDFSHALESYQRSQTRPPTVSGIGIVLTEDLGIVGIDLDNVRDAESGALIPWAADLIAELRTYTEVSPSGTGLRIFARGTLDELKGRSRKQDDGTKAELYTSGRYLTLTGDHLDGTPSKLRFAQAEIDAFHAERIAAPERSRPNPPSRPG